VITAESHYAPLAAAYVRGALGEPSLDDDAALARGAASDLDLHRFKRTSQLPRVRAVLGALRGFAPDRLLDLGSGRGAFVWPLLDALPDLPITATDLLERRMAVFAAVSRGGIPRLSAVRADMTALPFASGSFACVTALEVLEHIPGDGPERAAREAIRIARTAVIVTVPSHEDDNPEHVHLFDGPRLESIFRAAGARRVRIEHVLNHIVAVAVR
jgi:ubiquinone/menaquinone biosynthesis C-methylase UbiE